MSAFVVEPLICLHVQLLIYLLDGNLLSSGYLATHTLNFFMTEYICAKTEREHHHHYHRHRHRLVIVMAGLVICHPVARMPVGCLRYVITRSGWLLDPRAATSSGMWIWQQVLEDFRVAAEK
jgi:hypothetical protein